MIFEQKKHQVLGLIMAAGFSNRFGPDDKRKATWQNTTLLGATIENTRQWLPNIAVVIRPDDIAYDLGIPRGTPIIRASNASNGMGSSISDAMAVLLEGGAANGALLKSSSLPIHTIALLLGDMPGITESTFKRLVERSGSNRIVRPVHEGQNGHPVLFGKAYWPELAALTGDSGGKQIVKRQQAQVDNLAVDDPGVLLDVDQPQDLIDQPV
ncbi:nucleotidyltransferase family protein [Oceanobacter kriegii]|uniref:nucleotidyltransferase family protein n=1 Tax=Oceanobacter kriegii TaxID=64972 RepID=UPI00041C9E3D|nr:nucleotidyltransferase family protein [Oceanobacter kriegii]